MYKPIIISSNETVFREYDTGLRNYIVTPENHTFVPDRLPEAWRDPNVGGAYYELTERNIAYQRFSVVPFSVFQKEQREILTKALKDADAATASAIKAHLEILEGCQNWTDFGGAMKSYTPQQTSLIEGFLQRPAARKRARRRNAVHIIPWEKHDENGRNTRQALNALYQMCDTRYEAMQSIAYALTTHRDLPLLPNTAEYYMAVSNGVRKYNKVREKKGEPFFWFQGNIDNYYDDRAFEYVRKHIHRADGCRKAHEDALEAIAQSPEWPKICQFHYLWHTVQRNHYKAEAKKMPAK